MHSLLAGSARRLILDIITLPYRLAVTPLTRTLAVIKGHRGHRGRRQNRSAAVAVSPSFRANRGSADVASKDASQHESGVLGAAASRVIDEGEVMLGR